ncbi:MAG: hypothetical protein AAF721_04680 [Myxococcota bacterium]
MQFELLEGLVPPVDAAPAQRDQIAKAHAGMRRGLSELVLGCVNSLADADFPPAELGQLLGHLAQTLPQVIRSVDDPERAAVAARLQEVADNPALAALGEPVRALQAALDAAQTS